jgi:hypothetical protein
MSLVAIRLLKRGGEIVRRFQDSLKTKPWNDNVDDIEDVIKPFMWVVIVFTFVFIILQVVVSILLM